MFLLLAFEKIIFCTSPNFNNFFNRKLFLYVCCYFVFSKLILYISCMCLQILV